MADDTATAEDAPLEDPPEPEPERVHGALVTWSRGQQVLHGVGVVVPGHRLIIRQKIGEKKIGARGCQRARNRGAWVRPKSLRRNV